MKCAAHCYSSIFFCLSAILRSRRSSLRHLILSWDQHPLRLGVGLLKKSLDSVVQLASPSGVGSGFWVRDDLIVTCLHVVPAGTGSVVVVKVPIELFIDVKYGNVQKNDWEVHKGMVVATDRVNDLALVQISPGMAAHRKPMFIMGGHESSSRYKRVVIQSEPPEQLDTIFLSGFPLGQPYGIVQQGTMASLTGPLTTMSYPGSIKMLLSLVANHGNSGGPIFSSEGEVVGILEGALPSVSGEPDPAKAVSGLAVAIPAKFAEDLTKQFIAQSAKQ